MTRLPKNYELSPFVLQSRKEILKPKYESTIDVNGVAGWDANAYLKVKRDYALGNKTFATEAAYGNLMQMTKDANKSFNYSRVDKLSLNDNVILDLHDESNTIEKLDKMFDIRDGYKI